MWGGKPVGNEAILTAIFTLVGRNAYFNSALEDPYLCLVHVLLYASGSLLFLGISTAMA